MTRDELADLKDLVRSDGWQRLKDYAASRFDSGPLFHAAVRKIASEDDDTLAAKKLRELVVVQDAVSRLFNWPLERIQSLERMDGRA